MAALEETEEIQEALSEEGTQAEETDIPAEKADVPAEEADVPAEKANMPAEETTRKIYDEAYEKLYTEILEHFRSFSPSEQIAGKITEEHITEYLEGNREERREAYKERREKRFLAALELIAVLTSIVLVVWFLGDNPAILVNILYIFGGLGAFFIWKHPHTKDDKKE